MEGNPPVDSAEDNQAFDRIDALLAQAAYGPVQLGQTAPPVERILEAVEQLILIRAALERDATVTAAVRSALEQVLRDVAEFCDEWGFATARVRVDFTRDDLRRGYGDIEHDVTELVRHLRYDARSWNPNRRTHTERRYSTHLRDRAVAADGNR